MSPLQRLVVALAILAIGSLIGALLRRILTPEGHPVGKASTLPAGLVVVTAPYCTRCTNLQNRLDETGIPFSRVDAARDPARLQTLGIATAPTLLRVDLDGRVLDSEARDFSDERLSALAPLPG